MKNARTENNNTGNSTSKFINFILGLLLSLFILGFAVKFTLNFTPLYAWEIDNLQLDTALGMDKQVLLKNYKAVTDYIEKSSIDKLVIPDFAMSPEGEFHFWEVKLIFNKIDVLFYGSAILFLLIFILYKNRKSLGRRFLSIASWMIFLIPAALAVPFAVNFNKSFVIFHELFFDNDYWLFDPRYDPIINALPEEFFFHCAVLILLILVISFILLRILYKALKRRA